MVSRQPSLVLSFFAAHIPQPYRKCWGCGATNGFTLQCHNGKINSSLWNPFAFHSLFNNEQTEEFGEPGIQRRGAGDAWCGLRPNMLSGASQSAE